MLQVCCSGGHVKALQGASHTRVLPNSRGVLTARELKGGPQVSKAWLWHGLAACGQRRLRCIQAQLGRICLPTRPVAAKTLFLLCPPDLRLCPRDLPTRPVAAVTLFLLCRRDTLSALQAWSMGEACTLQCCSFGWSRCASRHSKCLSCMHSWPFKTSFRILLHFCTWCLHLSEVPPCGCSKAEHQPDMLVCRCVCVCVCVCVCACAHACF